MVRSIFIPTDVGYSQTMTVYVNGMPYEFSVGQTYTVDDGVADTIENVIFSYRRAHLAPRAGAPVLTDVDDAGETGGGASSGESGGTGDNALMSALLTNAISRIEELESHHSEFRLLNNTVLSSGRSSITLEADDDGNPYALKAAFLRMSIAAASSTATVSFSVFLNNLVNEQLTAYIATAIGTTEKHFCILINQENGYWRMRYMSPQSTSNTCSPMQSDSNTMFMTRKVSEMPTITKIIASALSSASIPAGSMIEVWGY